MSTPSMVLLCAGAASSLVGVWALAGLSERSSLRASPRALGAGVVGLGVLGLVQQRAPGAVRGELSLPLLFAAAGVLALVAGAGKLDAALAERDGARAVRRAAGLISGTFLGMAAVAAVSFELLSSSVQHARFGWACMLALVAAVLVVFIARGRLADAGAWALGRRSIVLAVAGFAVLGALRFTVTPERVAPPPEPPVVVDSPASKPVEPPPPAPPQAPAAPPPSESSAPTPAPAPEASAPPAAATSAAPPAGAPGELSIEAVVSKGLLEADARGGVARRFDKLQACLADPKNQQSGTLTLRIGIDASGSVGFARPTGGDLVGTPLATCLLPAFYKMGFAAPASSSAYFEITLRAPPR